MLGFLNMNPNITSFMYFPKIGLFIVEVEEKTMNYQRVIFISRLLLGLDKRWIVIGNTMG